ncbi:hypothetical protein DTL42_05250 [Bremerella cremea]|uniref:Uncharacterized protein n=1 Tax=Bremerella cremea TaxID=1031537 RepID=A0A368KXY3_9BACT|nr:hypothetical protein [Bremerella cremea]RCS54545.1 hypothetical protein DTL42_05250 [Bremerella cremea]
MMSRHLILGLFTVAMIAAVGCRTVPSCNSCQFADVTAESGCGCSDCGSTCGETCSGGSTCKKDCGPNYDICLPRIPFAEMRQRIRDNLTCGGGCSDEIYWGEWISDPPKCDPCDCFGNYAGPQAGPCRPGLLGIRRGNDSCNGLCDTEAECTSCAAQAKFRNSGYVETIPAEGTIIYDSEIPHSTGPMKSMVPTPASPSDEVYYETQSIPQPSYPTSAHGGRHPAKLGRGSM